jgi:flagellar biosynthesis protein FlhG
MNTAPANQKTATIIPIAGGKGGVGKSLIAANLAIILARLGHKTIVIDLDLGAANLHSCLGLSGGTPPGLASFLRSSDPAPLESYLARTPHRNLHLLAGDEGNPFLAQLNVAQQRRLVEQIRTLPAEYVFLDLGAGSSFGTLDFFRIAHKGLLVTTPEVTSLNNLTTFLKNLAFRVVEHALPQDRSLHRKLRTLYTSPLELKGNQPNLLQTILASLEPEISEQVLRTWHQFHPRLIFNRGLGPDDLAVIPELEENLRHQLGLNIEFIGYIPEDLAVLNSLRQGRSLMSFASTSNAGQDMIRLARRVLRLWEQPIPNSARQLQQYTRRLYPDNPTN